MSCAAGSARRLESMQTTRELRAAGAAGVLATVMILGGSYLAVMGGSGSPGVNGDAAEWAAWAKGEESSIEAGVYALLVPGLLLFLFMFANLLSRESMSTRLAGYGAIGFFVFGAAAGVFSSTAASTFGFFRGFNDPTAVTVFTSITAGYHLQTVGVWSLAMTMLATGVGLRSSGALSTALYIASFVLAALAVAASLVGFGVIPCLVWILAASIGLLRRRATTSAT
jgi:hypothetical protein